MKRLCLFMLLVCTAGSLQAQGKEPPCADTPVDSTSPSPVYRACHVERKARVRKNGAGPQFTASPGVAASCYRATFEFVVDTAGKPELATVRRVSATSQSYGDAVEATLAELLYEPARLGNARVRQVVRFDSQLPSVQPTSASGEISGRATSSAPSGLGGARSPNC